MNSTIMLALSVLAAMSAGCAARALPSGWQPGGRRLAVPAARWVVGERTVELTANGSVLVDGAPTMTVDSAGRVYDPERRPIALLLANGNLLGPDDEALGWIGATEARGADDDSWLRYLPSGEVVRGTEDVGRPFGVWLGCDAVPYGSQTCLLVSHLIGLELRARAAVAAPGVSVGLGLGMGVGIGIGTP
ncbi:MAG: hypothetical protein EXR75_11780 [Myxococcales bacterium]|nr:hypothetical protein [Myxococcales bacterium]